MKKIYLEENGSRWYVKIGNKSDESALYPLWDIAYKFPYYVIFDEDTGIEATHPSLKELKEDESD